MGGGGGGRGQDEVVSTTYTHVVLATSLLERSSDEVALVGRELHGHPTSCVEGIGPWVGATTPP